MVHPFLQMKLIDQGRTAEIYETGNDRILKLFRDEIPIHIAEKEAFNASVIRSAGLPIPCYYGKISIDGRTGLKYEQVKGASMLRLFISHPGSLFPSAKLMAKLQLEIHQQRVNGLNLLKDELKCHIEQVTELDEVSKAFIIKRLEGLADDNKLCHGDMHPDNILMAEKGPVVIDWLTATSGNPAADVARTIVLLNFCLVPQHIPYLNRSMTNIVKSAFCRRYLKWYVQLSGIDKKEIRQWFLPVAAARLYDNDPKTRKRKLLKYIHWEIKKTKP